MQRTTKLVLDIIIVGGSVAGLTCAYSLRKGGHRVKVVEKRDKFAEIPGSLRCPPNMTRLLSHWPGMKELLENTGTKLASLLFTSGETAKTLGGMKFHEDIMKQLGADFYIVQYADFCEHLQRLCEREGVVFQYNTNVISGDTGRKDIVVLRTNRGNITGDIVIAADGRHSPFRQFVADEELDTIVEYSSVGVTVPTAKMCTEPSLLPLCNEDNATVWMNNGSFMFGGLSHSKARYNMEFMFVPPEPSQVNSDWSKNYSVGSLTGYNFEAYEPRIQKMIKLSDGIHPTTHIIYAPLDTLVDETNKVVLVGDAGHSTPIRSSHNSSMAVEDAVTLSNLLSRLTQRSQLPFLLNAYTEIRLERTHSTDKAELDSIVMVTLPDGPMCQARNAALHATLGVAFADEWSEQEEAVLAQLWASYLNMFNFDAIDSVDEWILQYGQQLVDVNGYFVNAQ